MYNSFETLERKCKAYYFKQNLKIIVPAGTLCALIGLGFLMGGNDAKEQSNATLTQPKPLVKESHKEIVKTKEIVKEVYVEPKKDVQYNVIADYDYVPKQTYKKPVEHKVKPKPVYKKPVEHKAKPKPKPVVHRRDKVENFMSVKKVTDVTEMIRLYNKEENYNVAIKIAQTYYADGKYKKSMFWAKKANMLNHEDEKAWILYAKSEYMQGHKEKAKNILKLYLDNAVSTNAKSLLLNWTQGK